MKMTESQKIIIPNLYSIEAIVDAKIGKPDGWGNPAVDEFKFEYFICNGKRHRIGDAELSVKREPDRMIWEGFYPLEYLKKSEGKGIGTISHILALQGIKEHYGEDIDLFKCHPGRVVLTARQKHLKAMGLSCNMIFSDYYKKSMEYGIKRGFISLS